MQDPDEPKPAFRALQLASVGLEMGIAVAIGAGAGYLADRYLHTTPWLLLLGVILGSIAGFKGMIDAAKKAKKALESRGDDAAKARPDVPGDGDKDKRDGA